MKVKSLDGRTHDIQLRKYLYDQNKPSKSKFQTSVGKQLVQKFPNDKIFEEVRIPGENLVLDFLIPSVNLAVECNGRQHTNHVKYFHGTRRQFHAQQDRDNRKRQWCELNGIKLIEIDYDDL